MTLEPNEVLLVLPLVSQRTTPLRLGLTQGWERSTIWFRPTLDRCCSPWAQSIFLPGIPKSRAITPSVSIGKQSDCRAAGPTFLNSRRFTRLNSGELPRRVSSRSAVQLVGVAL